MTKRIEVTYDDHGRAVSARVQRTEVSAIPAPDREATPPLPPSPARETKPGIGPDDPPETTRLPPRCQCPNRPRYRPGLICAHCGRPV